MRYTDDVMRCCAQGQPARAWNVRQGWPSWWANVGEIAEPAPRGARTGTDRAEVSAILGRVEWLDEIHVGDCRALMRSMIADGVRVNCVVSSPPYWGLRDYGTASWDGGDPACPHRVPATGATGNKGANNSEGTPFRDLCPLCGAKRVDRQIGLERSWIRHVARMRGVFRLVRELLADDGTCWLNYGDSYAHASGQGGGRPGDKQWTNVGSRVKRGAGFLAGGLKTKDLVGMPWRVAFALQSDGWYLRSDVIWHKPNPMPESVLDRPTKSHEYVFMLTRSPNYHYDASSIAEVATGRAPGNVGPHKYAAAYESGDEKHRTAAGLERIREGRETRNARTVWTIPPTGFSGAHFATFPRELVTRCILAGSRPGDVVFDPFMGSGTVAQVALSLGRRFIGTELNPAYAELFGTARGAQVGMAV